MQLILFAFIFKTTYFYRLRLKKEKPTWTFNSLTIATLFTFLLLASWLSKHEPFLPCQSSFPTYKTLLITQTRSQFDYDLNWKKRNKPKYINFNFKKTKNLILECTWDRSGSRTIWGALLNSDKPPRARRRTCCWIRLLNN